MNVGNYGRHTTCDSARYRPRYGIFAECLTSACKLCRAKLALCLIIIGHFVQPHSCRPTINHPITCCWYRPSGLAVIALTFLARPGCRISRKTQDFIQLSISFSYSGCSFLIFFAAVSKLIRCRSCYSSPHDLYDKHRPRSSHFVTRIYRVEVSYSLSARTQPLTHQTTAYTGE